MSRMISRRWTRLRRWLASCLAGESEHDRLEGRIDICTQLDDFFRVMVLLDMVELVIASGSVGRR